MNFIESYAPGFVLLQVTTCCYFLRFKYYHFSGHQSPYLQSTLSVRSYAPLLNQIKRSLFTGIVVIYFVHLLSILCYFLKVIVYSAYYCVINIIICTSIVFGVWCFSFSAGTYIISSLYNEMIKQPDKYSDLKQRIVGVVGDSITIGGQFY